MSDSSVVFSILATEKVTDTLGKIPGGALLSGAAIGAALMAGIDQAMDQESAANKLAAQLGATPAQAAHLGDIAGNLYSNNFGDSISDIDDALKTVIQNGLDEGVDDASLQAVTGKVITAAQLMGASYDDVSRSVSQMLRTGLAQSSDEAIDVLVSGMQMGVDKSGDLLDTFNEYPTEFRKLGISGTQAMGLLSQAIQAGARDSDQAADALKEFSIRAVDGSKLTAQGFQMLGLDAKKMGTDVGAGGDRAAGALDITMDRLRAIKDPVKQAQAATALFGTQAEDLGAALFAMDPSAAVDAMGKVSGAADAAGQTMNAGASANLKAFERQAEQTFVEVLGGKVIPLLDRFGGWLGTVGGWIQRNQGWLAPLAVTLGVFAGGIMLVEGATKAWAIAQALLDVAMDANPIGLIILAIVALAAGIAYLWTHSAAFRVFFIEMWDHIWGFIKGIGHWFAHDFVDFFRNGYNWIKDKTAEVIVWVVSRFNNLVANVTSLPGRVRAAASGMWDGVKDAFKSAVNWVIGRWNNLHFSIPAVDFLGFHIGGFTLNLPDIPMLAGGGVLTRGGLVGMNERGAEVVSLPTGAAVYPHGTVPAGAGTAAPAGPSQMRITGNGGLASLLREMVRTGDLTFFDSAGQPVTVLP